MSRENRKAALVRAMADHVLAEGLGGVSLRPLASAVGTSDRMLLYYFPDKPALIAAVLEEVAARMITLLEAVKAPEPVPAEVLEARLLPMVLDPAVWPFMQLWLEMAAQAARGDEACARVGEGIARGFVAWLEAQLDLADASSRSAAALRLLMTIEGGVLLKSLGLSEGIAAIAAPRGG
jgi:AcrR family transcriptional regulator